jgi:predicted nucleic acid-binding protein
LPNPILLNGVITRAKSSFSVYDEICRKWAEIMSTKGHPIAYADAWIAATAMAYKVPLIAHNRKHFESVSGLKVISEDE